MAVEVETEAPVEKYVKFPKTEWDKETKEGTEAIVKLRLLDYPGLLVFKHWIGEGAVKRPYNCPGLKNGCPACKERAVVKLRGGDDYKAVHRMEAKRIVNALELSKEDPKLKIFSYGSSIGKRLDGTIKRGAKFADPTTYDISVMKRQTGGNTFDVEYDVFYEQHRELTGTEKALATQKFDLSQEAVPANPEDINNAIKGVKTGPKLATAEQKARVDKVLDMNKLSYLDLRVSNPDQMSSDKAEEIIRDLG